MFNFKMIKSTILNKIYLTINLLIISSCSTLDFQELYFLGSSSIERWDVQFYFPNYITYNEGKSGAKIDYIEKFAGKYRKKTVILYIGTNDINYHIKGHVDELTDRFINAYNGLEAKRIYLYSLFPNNNIENNDQIEQNDLIDEINDSIRNKVSKRCPQIIYLDVHDKLTYKGKLNMQYSYDGLHLNNEGYEIISQYLINELNK